MVDELASVIEMSRSFKKSGRSATMTMSTRNGQATKVKLEVELDDATPSSVSPSPTSNSEVQQSPNNANVENTTNNSSAAPGTLDIIFPPLYTTTVSLIALFFN